LDDIIDSVNDEDVQNNIPISNNDILNTNEIDMSGINILYDEKSLGICSTSFFDENFVDIPYDKHLTPVSNFKKYTYLYNSNLSIILIIVK
jgi:hypothetical protein